MKLIPKYPVINRILSGFIICFCLVFSSFHLMAQNNVPRLTLNLAYYGNNIWNPGFNAGLDYTHGVEEGANRKGKEYIRQKFFNFDMGMYFDPGSRAGILTHAGINHRKFRENKINLHIGFSPLGIFRSFPIEKNEVQGSDIDSGEFFPGRFYYAPTLSLGAGKFWNNVPGTGWFFEIDLTGLIPYDTFAMIQVNTKLGLRARLDRSK